MNYIVGCTVDARVGEYEGALVNITVDARIAGWTPALVNMRVDGRVAGWTLRFCTVNCHRYRQCKYS